MSILLQLIKQEEILEKNSNFIKLKKFIEIKFNIVSKLESIPTEKHVNWYNYFIEYSSKNNSLSLLIPPDVIWSNSSFKNMLTILAKKSWQDFYTCKGLLVK